MQRRSFLKAAGAVAASASLAGCVGSAGGSPEYEVAMRSNAFVPADHLAVDVPEDAPSHVPRDVPSIEVSIGEPVRWLNTDTRYHTVTAASTAIPDDAEYFASGGFETERAALESFQTDLGGGGAIPPSEAYVHAFETPGWYYYYCIPHLPAGMMGNVHVVDE